MAEIVIALTLDQVQRGQLFAHLLVYLFHLGLHPGDTRHRTRMGIVLEVTCRLKYACRDEREQVVFPISSQETQAVKEVFLILQPIYEQAAQTEMRVFALDHLAACLALLEEAEQQASTGTGGRESKGAKSRSARKAARQQGGGA
jgi:hypothetical protein